MNHWCSWLGVFLVILVSTLFYSKIHAKKKTSKGAENIETFNKYDALFYSSFGID
jgi:hypothetical protein